MAQALLIGYVTYRSAEAIASAFSFTKNAPGSRAIARLFSFTNPLYSTRVGAYAPKRKRRQGAALPKIFVRRSGECVIPFAIANFITAFQSKVYTSACQALFIGVDNFLQLFGVTAFVLFLRDFEPFLSRRRNRFFLVFWPCVCFARQ